jgi:hypothetical protein
MKRLTAFAVGSLSAAALAIAPLTPAVADGLHGFRGHGFHHFGVAGALVGAIVGIATLPLAIAAEAAQYDRPQDERGYAPGYYSPPPAAYPPPAYYSPPAYYPSPAPYYGPPVAYYSPSIRAYARSPGYSVVRPRYTARSGYQAEARPGYYHYRH